MLPRLLAGEVSRPVFMPFNAAAYCADCEAVFDSRDRHTCPACASSVAVPVSCLIDKSSLLAKPGGRADGLARTAERPARVMREASQPDEFAGWELGRALKTASGR